MLRIADLYCGAGGETTGIVQALGDMGDQYDLAAVNHWDVAIQTHRQNHPQARHYCASLESLNPLDVFGARDRVDLLWASPECTHHSVARGGRPCSNQSRASAWLVLKWLSELYVRRVIIENVPEFAHWGPLGSDGRPLRSRRGDTFRAFVATLESLGYRVEWRTLCAADYGDPTTRKRFYLQAARGRARIDWPEPSHAENPGLLGERSWVPARDIIDWSIRGESISRRRRPLAQATLRRIEVGIRRYWGKWAEPFLVVLRGTGTAREIGNPLPTVTAGGNHLGLVEPLILHQCSDGRVRTTGEPLPVVLCRGAHSIVEPFLVKYNGTAGAQPVRIPLGAVTTRDRFGLVEGFAGLDITFRMLQPHELAAAQGFPGDYWFAGNRTQQVKQIGNAVPVNTARALVLAAMEAA